MLVAVAKRDTQKILSESALKVDHMNMSRGASVQVIFTPLDERIDVKLGIACDVTGSFGQCSKSLHISGDGSASRVACIKSDRTYQS